MVGNKKLIPLQQQINTDYQWEKLLEKEGLVVVDIYSDWCGPCIAMTPSLKTLKRTLGVNKLHLAVAKSDSIKHLERFRNRSQPTWMFLIGGKIVNVMYGANAPKLIRLITDELKKECAVKEGRRERVELDIADVPTEVIEEETESPEVIDQVPETEREGSMIISDEDFMYRPF